MNRNVQCANVRSVGSAHSHITPGKCTNERTLPAQTSLKALADAVLDRTKPRTIGAHSEHQVRTLPAHCAEGAHITPPNLTEDFRLVSTWWAWSPDDIATFKTWARQHRDEAAAWVHAEAQKVREYRDRLHCANATEFLSPAIPATTCTSTK